MFCVLYLEFDQYYCALLSDKHYARLQCKKEQKELQVGKAIITIHTKPKVNTHYDNDIEAFDGLVLPDICGCWQGPQVYSSVRLPLR